MTPMRGLYPIVDLTTLAKRKVPPLEHAAALLTARPAILQLRAKHQPPRDTLELLQQLLPLCRASGTLLFANDRPDLALLAGCDGVHVGQDDLSPHDVRRLAPSLRVGVSTHDETQLDAALAARPEYVAFGPVFSTLSKENPDPELGLVRVASAANRARRASIPLVVIGGLTLSHAPELGRLGVVAAVISDLLAGGVDAASVAARAQAFQKALLDTSI
jgi:thiamine-phosphate pyrophosphorylase